MDTSVDLFQEGIGKTPARPAVGAGVLAWNREFEDAAPRLDKADRFGAAGIAFEDLRNPRPKYGERTEVTISTLGFVGMQEIYR